MPRFGDMIRVAAGQFYHYGIYVSDEEIIQFGPTPDAAHSLLDKDIRVCTSDINGFLNGGFLEVASLSLSERLIAASPKEIVARARRKLGAGGYDILANNCEHFANNCVFGKKTSEQVDSVRSFWQSIPVLDVYVAIQPQALANEKLVPAERQKMMDAIGNPIVKAQRTFAWQVLCTGINRSLGLEAERIDLHLSETGKWISNACDCSLSHCDGAVAAAVSRKPVGIDIEPKDSPRYREKLLDKIATEKERARIDGTDAALGVVKLWTRKEALFKRRNQSAFIPIKEDATGDDVRTLLIPLDRDYIVSISAESFQNLRVYTVDAALHTQRLYEFKEL